MSKSKFSVQVGDKVAYSVQWLKSIGMSHSDLAHARGIVIALVHVGSRTTFAKIDWGEGNNIPQKVNVANLAKVGPNTRFANC